MKKPIINFSKPSQQQLNSLLDHYQEGRHGEAEKLAVSLAERFPKHPFSWKVLGAVLKQTGRITESLTAMQNSVQLGPQDAEAHNNLGNTLKEFGRLREAEACYRKALDFKPDYTEARHNLGVLLYDNKEYDLASEQFSYSDIHYL